ncbi:alpha/beta fold hydrolase [Granulicella sp. L60]|uniref:alpha/beta fold hydrolase n=1 Tax=Granulicella sp. L60 TaxID=1641866 RepID=UPI00131BEE80|nr:alpha/beta fold hydrolase [Granulicella sp. L60]
MLKALFFVVCSTFGLALCWSASAATTVKHPPGAYVEVDGARLWYETEGTGPALLLIAGGPGASHDVFHPYFSVLAATHRVIYFDSFGRGKSEKAKDPTEYSFDRDVRDVEALREALHLGKIDLFGHSYGGMVAQAYALQYPKAVSHLILSDTFYSGEMWQANNQSTALNIRNQFPETWNEIESVRAAGHNTCSKEYQDVANIPLSLMYFYNAGKAKTLEESGVQINLEVYCAIAGEDADFLIGGDIGRLDFRMSLAKIQSPILIISGRYDRISIPSWAASYARYTPQAKLAWFEQSGHFPFIEETEKTMTTIDAFLR